MTRRQATDGGGARMRLRPRLAGVVVVLAGALALAVSWGSPARAVGTVLPVDGFLDEIVVDAAGRKAYAANPVLDRIEVVDLATKRLEAPIAVGSGPVGLDLGPDGRYLYVANGGEHYLSVVDLALRREVRRRLGPAGVAGNETPYSVAVAANGTALVTMTFPGSGWTPLYQVDLTTGQVERRGDIDGPNGDVSAHSRVRASGDRSRIAVVGGNNSGGPLDVYSAASDSFTASKRLLGFVFNVALDRTGSVLMADHYVTDGDLVLRATLDPGPRLGLAVHPGGATGYRVQFERVVVDDLRRGLPAGTIELSDGADEASGQAAVTPDGATLVVATNSGLTILPTGDVAPEPPCQPTGSTSQLVKVCGAPLTEVVVDGAGSRAYATNKARNQVEVLSLATRQLEAPIPVGSRPQGLDFSADGKTLYVANAGGNDISVVDVASLRELRRITVPAGDANERPHSIAVGANGKALVTTTFEGSGDSALWLLDLAAETVQRPDRFDGFRTEVGARSRVKASADRSSIVLAEVESSGGYVFRFEAATKTFEKKILSRFLRFAALDATGSKVLVNPGTFVLDDDMVLRATVPAGGRGVASNRVGTTGYRVQDGSVEVLDLNRGLHTATIALPEAMGDAAGVVALTPDDATLVVAGPTGLAVVPVSDRRRPGRHPGLHLQPRP